jgi:DNA polymerase-1
VLKLTPGGAPSTDEPTINALALEHPEVRKIIAYRKPSKRINTYYLPMALAQRFSFDGYPHPDYRTTSVETGRLGSFFHTTPRDNRVRPIITAPEGWTFVQLDYSQIEARLAAWAAAGKPETMDAVVNGNMLRAWFDRRDVYRETAAEFFRIPLDQVTKEQRQDFGKVPVLANLYRISTKGFRKYAWDQAEIALTMEEAERACAAFHNLYPEFKLWHEREERILRMRGYALSAIGRVRRIPAAMLDATPANGMLIHEAVNAGINMPIQSLAADITQTAAALITKYCDHSRVRLSGNVHDALLPWIRTEFVDEELPRIAWCMLNSYRYLRPLGLHIPDGLIRCEITVGNWGEGKEVFVDPVSIEAF